MPTMPTTMVKTATSNAAILIKSGTWPSSGLSTWPDCRTAAVLFRGPGVSCFQTDPLPFNRRFEGPSSRRLTSTPPRPNRPRVSRHPRVMSKNGSRVRIVGFSCREIASCDDQPDNELAKGINRFDADCRECRVSSAGETSAEIPVVGGDDGPLLDVNRAHVGSPVVNDACWAVSRKARAGAHHASTPMNCRAS